MLPSQLMRRHANGVRTVSLRECAFCGMRTAAAPTVYPFAEPVPSTVLTGFAMDFERVINGL